MIAALRNHCKRFLITFLVVFCFNSLAVAQKQYYSWDFSDCELKDILYAVSLDTGISIVPDDTVSGKGDFKFAGKDFYAAFDAFLNCSRLYVQKGEKLWTVSRFSLRKENGFYYVGAYDLTSVQIVEKISAAIDKVITFDSLPGQRMSLHFRGVDEITLMDSLCKRFGNYEIVKNEKGFHFIKKNETKKLELSDGFNIVDMKDNDFLIDVKNCFLSEVLEKLFELEKTIGNEKNFCLLANGDVKIQRAVFREADLTATLKNLCWQSGFSFVQDENIYYFFPDGNAKNSLLNGNKEWIKISLNYIKTQDFLPLIYKRIGKLEIVEIGDNYSFLILTSAEERTYIQELINFADIKRLNYLVTLNYIKPEDLLAYLPPSIDKNSLSLAGDSKSVYFTGTEKEYENLLYEIEICDQPITEITYDLLILQYDETQQNLWSSGFDCKRLNANSRNNLSAVLGSVMGLNLNVINAFGLNFAAELQTSIEDNNTKVYADTTLHGLPGKLISFQNTNTFRYRDNNVNPETGVPIYSGVTREISSGIKLDVIGWVSGEGIITSKVTASVSRQGNDTSASTGNPPPTSEKIVTTEVCGKSGEPVILSGLVLNSDSAQEKGVPFFSKIPLLGYLFKDKSTIKEKCQMVIYLVPHISNFNKQEEKNRFNEDWVNSKLEALNNL